MKFGVDGYHGQACPPSAKHHFKVARVVVHEDGDAVAWL
jgi:hypothetical protein